MELDTLEDLFPEVVSPAKFKLTKTGDTEYQLVTPTIKDMVEIERLFGNWQKISEYFDSKNFDQISKLIYFLLEQSDKKKFLARDSEEINADGELIKRRLTGPEVMMEQTSVDDIDQMSGAILQAYANASPKVRKVFKESNDKKKAKKLSQQTGATSLTLQPQSTDTPLSSSAP